MKSVSFAALGFFVFFAAGVRAEVVSYATIADANAIVTGVRSDSTTTDSVVLTANYATTMAGLYQGSLEGALTAPSSSWHTLTPVFTNPTQTVTAATFYGPNTSLFDPSLGAGNVVAVGSYKYAEGSPGASADHGLLYVGPVTGGGTWTQIDPTPLLGRGESLLNTIAHSTMGNLVVGNYDTDIATGKAFIYDRSNNTWRNLNPGNTVSVTAYGIWQNGGSSSTSFTIAGGQSSVNSSGIDESYLVNYDSATHSFSNYTVFPYNNVPNSAILAHFDGITGTSTGYNLTGFITDVSKNPVSGFFVSIARNGNGSFSAGAWTPISYPGSAVTTGNTIVANKVMGIYVSGGTHSYIATVDPETAGVAVSVAKSGPRATFTITNTGNVSSSFLIAEKTKVKSNRPGPKPTPPAPAKPRYSISYKLNGETKTNAVTAGRAAVTLAPGASAKLVEKVKALDTLFYNRTIQTTIEATSETDPSQSDSAKVKLVLPAN